MQDLRRLPVAVVNIPRENLGERLVMGSAGRSEDGRPFAGADQTVLDMFARRLNFTPVLCGTRDNRSFGYHFEGGNFSGTLAELVRPPPASTSLYSQLAPLQTFYSKHLSNRPGFFIFSFSICKFGSYIWIMFLGPSVSEVPIAAVVAVFFSFLYEVALKLAQQICSNVGKTLKVQF